VFDHSAISPFLGGSYQGFLKQTKSINGQTQPTIQRTTHSLQHTATHYYALHHIVTHFNTPTVNQSPQIALWLIKPCFPSSAHEAVHYALFICDRASRKNKRKNLSSHLSIVLHLKICSAPASAFAGILGHIRISFYCQTRTHTHLKCYFIFPTYTLAWHLNLCLYPLLSLCLKQFHVWPAY